MPTYEYECTSCGHHFEILQKMSDKPKTKCPECGKKLKKLISSTGGFIFKGPGFYATDYKKRNNPPGSCPAPHGGGCAGCPGHK
ncbi:MAG: zinc ribbon domain-containing protein [Candidatus Omnitrophica bacterium]|nr:zinc ribbon domain-containing protein [Candidatus Omnitrophota bacterium]MDD3275153.1 zinc ribbon domain-containing protein [Candidatus Omnitrophota bacterium]MDD5078686.1 zinc ribbon domain-containing protein [Candidatus Omnitrophota bacterium]MDD5725320.1 zinc ribbon domain-containing protein [Candidatus Omnitrophota bacterium]